MNYRVNRNGEDLGIFPQDELQRKRQTGEFHGAELVWRAGMTEWQPLDSVLQAPLRAAAARRTRKIILCGAAAGITALLVAGVLGASFFIENIREQITAFRQHFPSDQRGVELAGPLTVAPDVRTAADQLKVAKEFRVRHYLEGYKQRADRDNPSDGDATLYLNAWLAHYFQGDEPELPLPFEEFSAQLAADPHCNDPIILTILGATHPRTEERVPLLERALERFKNSEHAPYPQFWATVVLTTFSDHRTAELDASALHLFEQALADGSLPPHDQETLAEIFVHSWAADFFKRNLDEVCHIAATAGDDYRWLALILDGQRHVSLAWRARGSGYSQSVTRDGWQGFADHLAQARNAFTAAWEMHPEWPVAATRMIQVAMGQSGPQDTRLWFERAVAAQIDYPEAWARMRWALRPRWLGSHNAMLTLGITAVDTNRFDTNVPSQLFPILRDIRNELGRADDDWLFDRDDVWPHVARMCEGYIAESTVSAEADELVRWRSTYAAAAFLARHYDIAREQLEAIGWNPLEHSITGWGADLSLMTLEIAARTGDHRDEIAAAEAAMNSGDFRKARRIYQELSTDDPDERTAGFVQARLAALPHTES